MSKSAQELKNRFNAEFENANLYRPIYHGNSFARPVWPVITNSDPGHIQLFEWSLLPSEKIAPDKKTQLTRYGGNARSEDIENTNLFKGPFTNGQRCIIPSSGFWEWRKEEREKQMKTKTKMEEVKFPYFIQDRERDIMPMAGLYSVFYDLTLNQEIGSFTILTCEANEMMMYIHNKPAASDTPRMPVILSEQGMKDWLNPDLPTYEVKQLMKPYPADLMKAYTVESPINNPKRSTPTIADFKDYQDDKIRLFL